MKINCELAIVIHQYFYNLFSGVEYKIVLFYLDGASKYMEGFPTGLRLKAHQSLHNWEGYLLKALRI